jgi:integrase
MGSIYQPKLRSGARSARWVIAYYAPGRGKLHESTHSTSRAVAVKLLKDREGRAAAGEPMLPRTARVRWEEAAADLRQYYVAHKTRDLREYDRRVKPLDRFFAGRRLASLGTGDATAYAAARRAEGRANGTIRRELGTLAKALKVAYENGKLLRLPILRKPPDGPPRAGFFETAQFDAVRSRLPEDLQVAVTLAHTYGWRMQSEILALERPQVDLKEGTVRLAPGTTKNDEGRIVYLTPEITQLLAAQLARVDRLQRELQRIIPFVFPHFTGPHRGRRVRDFRKAWKTACAQAGVAGRYVHDLRRTAVRNIVNAGISERVAMTITGHKTRSVFDRYHIVSPGDLQEAARRLAGHSSGHSRVDSVDGRHISS